AIAKRLDEAAPLLAGLGRELERHLGHVDDYPIGIGQSKGTDIDLLADIDDEAHLLVVTAEPYLARHREIVGGARLGPGRGRVPGHPGRANETCAEDGTLDRCAQMHGCLGPPNPSYSIRDPWLIGS